MNIPRLTVFALMAVLCGLVSFAGSVRQAGDAGVRLRAAIEKEEVDGDLQGAIDLYRQIVSDNVGGRAVAAKALLRLGGCYEKLGREDARKTYQQLVNEYKDQQQEVEQARQRLVALATTGAKPRFTRIRVPTGLPNYVPCALSPDGEQLAYVDRGSVWLVPVHGKTDPAIAGAPRQITQQNETWTETTDIAWSRNGKWLALKAKERDSGEFEYAVYMVSSSGGEPRRVPLELKSRERIFHDCRLSLSPDGKWLAYTTWPKDGSPADRSVYLAPTDGGPSRRLTRPITSDPAFSPDGTRIAYVRLAGSPDWEPGRERGKQLWITSTERSSPALVYELTGPGRIAAPTWSPDGKTLAVLVNHENRFDDCRAMLMIPVGSAGRAGSPAELTLPYPVAWFPAGWSVCWSSGDQIGLILERPLEAAIYAVPSSGGKAVQLTPDWAMTPSWSPDGNRIYFQGNHFDALATIESVPSRGGKMEQVIIPAVGPNHLGLSYLGLSYPGTGISVSPDGKKIMFMGSYRGTAKRFSQIFTVPVQGGAVAELTDGIPATNPCWSPDGASIAFIGWESVDKDTFVRNIYTKPVKGGQTTKLTSQSDQVAYAGIAWSPDGSQIAFHSDGGREIKLIPAGGGEATVLVEGLKGYRRVANLAWSPDGKELLYSTENRIWKLNLETGKTERLQTGLDLNQTEMAWSPDGKTIALSGVRDRETGLWLMDSFLPPGVRP